MPQFTNADRIVEQNKLNKGDLTSSLAGDALGPTGVSGTGAPTFVLGGDNTDFYNQFEVDNAAILGNLQSSILRELLVQGNSLGQSQQTMQNLFENNWSGALSLFDSTVQQADKMKAALQNTPFIGQLGPSALSMGGEYYTKDVNGFNELVRKIWTYYKSTYSDLGDFGVSGEGVRKSGGSRGPTAADIRNRFDLNQLSDEANNIWRSMLLTEPADGRAMARSYIEAVVGSKGEKKIDFTTFIKNKARDTARYASIYQGKDPSLSEEAFLTPFFNTARQVVAPNQAADIAVGGAQFGADPTSFAQRLKRTDAVTGSAPFINELEGRMRGLTDILKG